MKIAHFYDGIYWNGGVSSYIQSLTRLQIAAGDEVLYFELTPTTPENGGITPILVADEAELYEICRSHSVKVLHFHKYAASLPPADLNVVYTVHEHTPHCLSGALFLKRRRMPCPRTYNFFTCAYGHVRDHCGSLRPQKFIGNLKRIHIQQAVIPAMKTICVGNFLKDRMITAGYPDANIAVIPNFADIDAAIVEMPASGIPQFLFIGRLEKMKGLEWLLRSFHDIGTPAILNICGIGGEEQRLQALATELGLRDRVNFLGWVDRAAKISLLQAARAVIVPSIWHETFGLVAIEAAACARPLIVSNAGELPYIVAHGDNGLVVETGNIPQLTAAIDDLAGNAAKARAMGANNLQKYQMHYTPTIHKRQIDEAYASTLLSE